MHTTDTLYEMARVRQEELRALAKPQPLIPIHGVDIASLRLRLGRVIVRLGRWIDTHGPEPVTQPELPIT